MTVAISPLESLTQRETIALTKIRNEGWRFVAPMSIIHGVMGKGCEGQVEKHDVIPKRFEQCVGLEDVENRV